MGKTLFENMGIKYLGPIDGHNLKALIKVLKRTKNEEYPVLVHVHTRKGRGFASAEEEPERYHGVAPKGQTDSGNYSAVFGHLLTEMALQDPGICAITAGMAAGTGLEEFAARIPERFFDVGIAEQHAVGMAAGLAKGGYAPFVAIYSTFLQRAMDQIFQDVCLQKLPVVLCIDRSGLVGQDGQTHQGIYDLAFLRQLNLPIMAPANAGELARMLPMARQLGRPCAIRYCKYLSLSEEAEDFAFGQWSLSEDGGDAALVSFGSMLEPCARAAEILRAEGWRVAVVNARFLNPLDDAVLRRLHAFRVVCAAEDNRPVGGLAEAIRVADPSLPLLSAAVLETAVKHGEIATQRKENGLDADSLADRVRKALV